MKFAREHEIPSEPADASKFSSGVWQAEVLKRIREGGLRGHRFAYAPRGRSNWHVHTGEQALVVLSGHGLVKREGSGCRTGRLGACRAGGESLARGGAGQRAGSPGGHGERWN
jgi:hypothetical protein